MSKSLLVLFLVIRTFVFISVKAADCQTYTHELSLAGCVASTVATHITIDGAIAVRLKSDVDPCCEFYMNLDA